MKIKYLGTAAAEGIPGMFCNCEVCQNARKVGGKEIKTRSQAIVDGKILIDFPADTYMHILKNNINIADIHTAIITHSHMDHLYPNDFWCRGFGIAHNIVEQPLEVYLTEPGFNDSINTLKKMNVSPERVLLRKISAFKPFESEGYRFIPLIADHASSTGPVFYIIEKDGKSLLYAHDTGYFPEATWEYLSEYNGKFNFISIDCTIGFSNWKQGHMGMETCNEVIKKLESMGLCDNSTVTCLNHFSHNGHATHEQFSLEAEKYGFITSYDGLEIEF